ncbi:MAG: phage tail protein [Leadbetterella sp.]
MPYIPPQSFRFKVTFQGINGLETDDVLFQEVSGLNTEVEIEEVKDGAFPHLNFKFPKKVKYTNLILKRGTFVDSGLIKYFSDALNSYFVALDFSFSPCDITVEVLNEELAPVVSWTVFNAFPVKWNFSDLKATDTSAILIETLEFSYQRLKRN